MINPWRFDIRLDGPLGPYESEHDLLNVQAKSSKADIRLLLYFHIVSPAHIQLMLADEIRETVLSSHWDGHQSSVERWCADFSDRAGEIQRSAARQFNQDPAHPAMSLGLELGGFATCADGGLVVFRRGGLRVSDGEAVLLAEEAETRRIGELSVRLTKSISDDPFTSRDFVTVRNDTRVTLKTCSSGIGDVQGKVPHLEITAYVHPSLRRL